MAEKWERYTIGEAGTANKGSGINREQASSGSLPAVRYGEIYTNYDNYISEFQSFVSEEVAAYALPIQQGDVLFTTSGETKEAIGKCATMIDEGTAYAGGDLFVLTPNKKFDPLFLGYVLNSSYVSKQKERMAQGDAIVHISTEALKSIEFYAPPYEEQRRIAEALYDIDGLILSLGKIIKKKTAIKQGVMRQLLSGEKRVKGYTEKWETKSLSELCYLITKQTGFDYSAVIKPSLLTINSVGTLPFIQNKDFEGFSINLNTDFYIPKCVAQEYPKICLNERCLLISISGRIGNVASFAGDDEAFVGGAVGVAKFYDKTLVDWCMLYLQSDDGQRQIFESEKAGAQHNLTVADVREFLIPIPQKEEREEIVSFIFDLDSELKVLHQKLNKISQMKIGMMNELLTGRKKLL